MKARIVVACLITFVIAAIIGLKISARSGRAPETSQKLVSAQNGLVVHEWGTFTSIAGKDGIAMEWRPLNGPTDLPKFVHTFARQGDGLRHSRGKAELRGLVRMETPVVYFYSANEMDVSFKVSFSTGKITEWYPQARSLAGGLDWGRFRITPGAAVNLPIEYSTSHYYAARETDAASVQVCGTTGKPAEQEKFLFYRGVGTFDLPLSVQLDGENILLKNLGKDQIGHLIIFENRGGKIGYQVVDAFTGELVQRRPALDKNIENLLGDLKDSLVASGLYEKEATAMIKTWRDSWFEEGRRVFYILPRQRTDAVLPVTIDPEPAELVRVLVGRVELITPEMEKSVQKQVSLLADPSADVREQAAQAIRKYGRFSEPILKRILETETEPQRRERIRWLIDNPAAKARLNRSAGIRACDEPFKQRT